MKVLVDQQLPPALALWLTGQGVDAVHVRDLGLASASDSAICDEAVRREAIVVTKDDDFVRLFHRRGRPPVVWVRLGNCSNAVLLTRLQTSWPAVAERLRVGEKLVELR